MGEFDALIDLADKYVQSHEGILDHTAWLDFLSDVERNGFELSDNIKYYLVSERKPLFLYSKHINAHLCVLQN